MVHACAREHPNGTPYRHWERGTDMGPGPHFPDSKYDPEARAARPQLRPPSEVHRPALKGSIEIACLSNMVLIICCPIAEMAETFIDPLDRARVRISENI
jgi:hypothetical protein